METHTVTSKDGTTIGYHQVGKGPGLVVLHGAMESSQSHLELAGALSSAFTVYLPDRRGRGLSGPYGAAYSIQTDVDDFAALVAKTGATGVLGVSSGAIIALHACPQIPAIQKAAIFEPPLGVDRAASEQSLKRFDAEIADGKTSASLVTAMRATQMGPAVFKYFPRWLLEGMTTLAMSSEKPQTPAPDGPENASPVPMRELAPTLHYDFELAISLSDEVSISALGTVTTEVLLLSGGKSPPYLRSAVDRLEAVLPNVSRRLDFAGAGHGVTGNANRRGEPQRVAVELQKFFSG
ncbi:MAG: hypothetical protein M1839_006348 [Geoglossum umbratile]|nr:MAG: hypothetical protein M1839_006348 [Geoglossum umbratile]